MPLPSPILMLKSRSIFNSRALFVAIALEWLAATGALAHPPVEPAPASSAKSTQRVDEAAEAQIHTPPGFKQAGKPMVADGAATGLLKLSIMDAETRAPAFCRVNVVGSDGNYYEPTDNLLAPYSLHRLGNRAGKGPFRYYGWFFYTSGEFEVRVPAGATRVEVWKGFEFKPQSMAIDVLADRQKHVTVTLQRAADLSSTGYYSGDVHIHLARQSDADEQRALDLMAAEDIRFGLLLANNKDGNSYSGVMDRNLHPQRVFGKQAITSRGDYSIAAGQEIVNGTYGHILLFLHDKLVLDGLTVEPNYWPPLGVYGREARKLGGYAFHAHGGYAQEIFADFIRRDTNGVELLQFAEFRGVGLEGWYRMLNIGYQFPALGACDYPYCRALGDCRTYVYRDLKPTFREWCEGLAEGRSFFTTGPFILLEVDGWKPGHVIKRNSSDKSPLKVSVRIRSAVVQPTEAEIIVNGRGLGRRSLRNQPAGEWFEFEHAVDVDGPLWIAARTWNSPPAGQPDAEAHTNPVYITVDGKPPYSAADIDWLIAKHDELIAAATKRKKFEQQAAAIEFLQVAKQKLVDLRAAGGPTALNIP